MGVLYLVALGVALTGMALLDRRFALFFWRDGWRAAVTLLVGVVFFLVWDVVGIVTGVFVKGESPLFIGVTLAPHLPLEEVFFLLFLSYLSIVMFAVFERRAARRRGLGVSARHPAGAPGERP